jgi:predicted DNA-binding protein (MmcQ/YjbR family)
VRAVPSGTLRAEHSAVRPGHHLNKRHWITVTLDNSLPDELVFGLPKRERDRVRLSANR